MIDSLPVGTADLAYSVAFAVAESALDDHPSPAAIENTMGSMYLYDSTVAASHADIHMDTPPRTQRRDSYRELPKPSKGTASPWNCRPFSMIPSPSSRPSSPVNTQTFSTTTAIEPTVAKANEVNLNTPPPPPGLTHAAEKEPRTMRPNAPVFLCRPNSAGKMHTRSRSELLPPACISSPPRTTMHQQLDQSDRSQRQHRGRPAYHRASTSVSAPRETERGMLPFPREVQPATSRTNTGTFSDRISPSAATPPSVTASSTTAPETAAAVSRSTPVRGRAGLPTLAEITAHYRAQGRTHSVTVSELQEIASPPLTGTPLPEANTYNVPATDTAEGNASSQAMVKRYSLESNDSYGSSQSYTSRSSADDTDAGMPTTPPPCDIVAFGTGSKPVSSDTGSNAGSRLPSFLRDRALSESRKGSSPASVTSTPSTTSTLAKALAKHRRRAVSQATLSSPAPGSTSPGHARRTGSMDSYPMVATPPSRSILGMGTATPMVQVTPPSTKLPSSATFTSTSRPANGNADGGEADSPASRRWPQSMRSPSAGSGYAMMQQMKDEGASPRSNSKFLSTALPSGAAIRPQVTTAILPDAPTISFTPPTAPPAKADSSTCAEFEALVVNARRRRNNPRSQTPVPKSPLAATHITGKQTDTREKENEDSLRKQRAERMLSALGKRRAEARSSPGSGARTGVVMEI